MLLKTRDGVRCDLCGREFRSKFVYYSYDCHKVTVDTGEAKTERNQATDVNGSIIGFDICEECHKSHITKMLENQK
jgi:hypothetical protein